MRMESGSIKDSNNYQYFKTPDGYGGRIIIMRDRTNPGSVFQIQHLPRFKKTLDKRRDPAERKNSVSKLEFPIIVEFAEGPKGKSGPGYVVIHRPPWLKDE